MKTSFLYLISSLLSAAMLVGCGGSSGGGGASAADITADNADDLSVAAAEATSKAVESASSGGSISNLPFKTSNSAPLQNKLESAIRSATTNISANFCTSGGSASMDANTNYTSGSISFSNCDDGYATYTGNVTFSGDLLGGGSYSITYTNFTVTDNTTNQSQTVNGTISCTSTSCNYDGLSVGGVDLSNSDFVGDDGRNYRFQGDVTVTGDDTYGWNVNATLVDPDHGAITIDAQNITFSNCGVPTGGTITVTGNGQTATVTFIDCNSFSVSYNGATTAYNWSTYGL